MPANNTARVIEPENVPGTAHSASLDLVWVDSARGYDAFLSCSWKSDREVAPVIQSIIERFLCPWYKLRAKTVFRDLSCLPAGSSLENELFDRLDRVRRDHRDGSVDTRKSAATRQTALGSSCLCQ